MPVSRDIDCYSLAKISEILAGAKILPTPIFVTFSAQRAGTTSRYSAGESPPIKAGRHTWRLHVEGSSPSGRCRRSSARSGRSQLLWTLPSQTVRRCSCACANILSMLDFCRCEISVGVRILLTLTFCRREYFVDPNILSTSIFSVDTNISVYANILSPPFRFRHASFPMIVTHTQ